MHLPSLCNHHEPATRTSRSESDQHHHHAQGEPLVAKSAGVTLTSVWSISSVWGLQDVVQKHLFPYSDSKPHMMRVGSTFQPGSYPVMLALMLCGYGRSGAMLQSKAMQSCHSATCPLPGPGRLNVSGHWCLVNLAGFILDFGEPVQTINLNQLCKSPHDSGAFKKSRFMLILVFYSCFIFLVQGRVDRLPLTQAPAYYFPT